MATTNIKAVLDYNIEAVWEVVTSLDNYAWRSDLSKIEVVDVGKKFVEYTKNGYATTFTLTSFEPMSRYEFDMNNKNMHGHWIGLFSNDNGRTKIDFTENVTPQKIFLKPFVNKYLKKQQAAYIADLQKALALL